MSNFKCSECSWRRCDSTCQNGHASYRRPLGDTELRFYWDSVFNGVGTTIGHMVLEVEPEFERDMFARENIELAWLRLKQRYPLLAASVDELPNSGDVQFILNEQSLYELRPGEVNFLDSLESIEDVARRTERFQSGDPVLTSEIIAKLWIGPQKDAPRTFHAFTVVAHYIYDGVTGAVLQRELCQELSSLSKNVRAPSKPLEERLATLVPVEVLNPANKVGRPRRHWRTATAKIVYNLRRNKLKGGHTLPQARPIDPARPARSRTVLLRLSSAQTDQIIEACRTHGITFGNALPVLSQLAYSRVLYRYSRSKRQRRPAIGAEEWDYRRIQPMHFQGPISLRPYLDHEWYEAGGASEICVALGDYEFSLPFMPLTGLEHQGMSSLSCLIRPPMSVARWLEGPRDLECFLDDYASDSDEPYGFYEAEFATIQNPRSSASVQTIDSDAPSFSSLLSQERFLARARIARTRITSFSRQPLLLELQAVRMRELSNQARALGTAWRTKRLFRGTIENADNNTTPETASDGRYVVANGGGSMGNRDLLLPLDYPMQSDKRSARLHIRDSIVHSRCRPGELYLGALTSQRQLNFFTYVDADVYDLDLVREWMEDIRAAALHYLGPNDIWINYAKNMGYADSMLKARL